ncbi:hypothetical protein EDD80_11246 [Anseongella ginsenosidimutans]|uniref:ABC-type branched-subunit amino acid transport system substrate-binding protein n=1 Tax=Anseongella ginsenosidimutans TaxID=496056 RepID=A0A4R3KME7_9SPHI|nr:amino acid ABC transporter substrate-binding protein [Anseongella ginsenosidimutans]QEC52721.1 amino acid ABC transporter substrate-binding protein [Anseongella ginsenosidimutans]TCS85471.1 hypothetical protein EDD80_11246 [Anseongella ginsenosidimutans]
MTSVPNLLQRLNGNSRFFLCLFLAAGLGFSSCSRKVFTGKGRQKEKEKEEVKEEPEVEKDKGPFKREAPVLSLLLPFRLDQVDPGSANSLESLRKSEVALDFYQGFRMGLDSLSAMGASFKLQVYDTRDENTTISRLTMKPELAESELIVGPVFPSGMNIIGRFAQNHQVYFISPLAPRIAVEDNAYQIVATAPMEMHTNKAAGFIAGRLRPSSVLVLSTANAEESKYIGSFMKQMREKSSSLQVTEIDVGSFGSNISSLKEYLHEGQNVLVVPSLSSTFWKILFSYLDMQPGSYQFSIIAHPELPEVENIDMVKAEKYQVYLTSSGGMPPKAESSGFYHAYEQKYGLPPSAYAAKGFDLAMYFGTALWNQGQELTEAIKEPYSGYHNEFDFSQTPDGYINRGVKVLKAHNYEFSEVEQE